jgi:hypothetical protein
LNVEIVLNSPGATVTGKISNRAQQPSSRLAVVLAPLEHTANMMLYRRTTASNSGTFSFSGVAPGRYRVLAFENLPDTAELDRRFLSSFRNAGTEITATGGATTTVEVKLVSR